MKDVGRLLERIVGRAAFIALYVSTGLLASLASVIWYGDTVWSAGASGAVFGIYGALLAISLRDKRNLPLSLFAPIRKSSIAFIAYNLIYGLAHEGIDNAAHVGGLLSGFALGTIIVCPLNAASRASLTKRKLRHLAVASLALIATGGALSPTFDYDPYEQEALFSLWNAFGDDEMKVYTKTEKILDQAEQSPEHRAQATATLRDTLFPFYQKWSDRFSAATYRSESSTERSRSLLADYASLKARAHQAFIDYLASPSDESSETYWNLVNQAEANIAALHGQ